MITQLMRLIVYGPAFALLWAIPGALAGLAGGYFDVHRGVAFGVAIAFILLYPRSRQRRGDPADYILYMMTAFGAGGMGISCFLVGRFISEIKAAG
jgi:hypothetical protein